MKNPIYENEKCLAVKQKRFCPHWARLDWGQAVGLTALIFDMHRHLGEGQHKLVELGSAIGESSSLFAGTGVFGKTWHVDTWSNAAEKEICHYNLSRYPRAEMIQGDMFVVEKGWKEQVDAIYIDADHEYESVMKGLIEWDKHLKSGGIWSGHDYAPRAWPGVVQAVDEFFGDAEIKIYEDCSWMVIKE